MHFWKMVSHTTVLFASLNLTIWWPSPVSCHESLNPARHPRLSFQTHSMHRHRFDMLTGHDVMHSASAYALQYISMEESELSERFFMFFLCCTILILFFVFFGPRAGCVSPLWLLWLVCLLTLVPFVVVFLLCWFWRVLLTELVSYMYPIYVHYMYILDVLSFPFGSRRWPYWDCEVRSKSERSVSCIAPTVLWLFYNTDHNRQIYRGHITRQVISRSLFRQLNQRVVRFVKTRKLGWCSPPA